MSASPLREWLDRQWPIWAAATLRGWMRLVRTTQVGVEQTQGTPCAVALWHEDELSLIARFGHLAPTILVSRSRDGENFTRAIRYLGYRVRRGSSTRGAVGGLIALIRAVREGETVVVAVDGPQGPRGVCKPGIIRIVQKTRAPLFPVGVAVSRRYVLKKTWSQSYFPLPFSRQVIWVGRPLSFPETNDPGVMKRYCEEVAEALHAARQQAGKILKGEDCP